MLLRDPVIGTARSFRPNIWDLALLPLAFAPAPDALLMASHPRQSADPAHTWLRQRFLQLLTPAKAATLK